MSNVAKVIRANVTQKVEVRFFMFYSIQFSSVSHKNTTTPETVHKLCLDLRLCKWACGNDTSSNASTVNEIDAECSNVRQT